MIANFRLKCHLFIFENAGKNLSDVLDVDDLLIPHFIISYDNIIITNTSKSIHIFDNLIGTGLLYFATYNCYYRNHNMLWCCFDIGNTIVEQFEDIV